MALTAKMAMGRAMESIRKDVETAIDKAAVEGLTRVVVGSNLPAFYRDELKENGFAVSATEGGAGFTIDWSMASPSPYGRFD